MKKKEIKLGHRLYFGRFTRTLMCPRHEYFLDYRYCIKCDYCSDLYIPAINYGTVSYVDCGYEKRIKKIKYELTEEHNLYTTCPYWYPEVGTSGCMVNSTCCSQCKNNKGKNEKEQVVYCDYEIQYKNSKQKKKMKLKRVVLEKKQGNLIKHSEQVTLESLIEKDACRESLKWVVENFKSFPTDAYTLYHWLKSNGRSSDAKWIQENYYWEFIDTNENEVVYDETKHQMFLFYFRNAKSYIIKVYGMGSSEDIFMTSLIDKTEFIKNIKFCIGASNIDVYLIENKEQLIYCLQNYV